MFVNRRLYRCSHDRRIAGVAAGLAEYFDLDPTLMRVLWFVSIFFTGGLAILLYLALAIIIPLEPMTEHDATQTFAVSEGHRHATRGDGSGRWITFFGLVLILFGGLALLDAVLPSSIEAWRYLGPAFIVGIGGLLVVASLRRENPASAEALEPPEPAE
jgi:phage shock protein PspC (stress-responsive transcriptional regulator)